MLFESLGLIVNQKKSVLMPTQELEFLGFHMWSVTITLSVPLEKLRKIQQNSKHMLGQESVSEGNSKVCGQSYGYGASHPCSPIALQSSPTIDELCPSPVLHPGGNIH